MNRAEVVAVLKWLALAVVLLVVLSLGFKAWKYYTAEMSGKVNAEVQIESAPSRIAGYESYFDQCAAIQGYEAAIKVQKDVLSSLDGEDAARTRTVIAGISAQRGRAIAQYNADARKAYTQARFLDSGLPKHIALEVENTQCAN